MLDIHTHLYWKSYDADREAVVVRAKEASVAKMICVGTEPEDNPLAIALAERYEGVYASVGIHPHFFNENIFLCHSREGGNPGDKEKTGSRVKPGMTFLEDCVLELKNLAKHQKVKAIGECGLDYFSRDSEKPIAEEQKKLQKEGFIAQLELAQELELPVIIHCRDAYEDMFEILKNLNSRFVLHCYMGDTEVTKKFLELPNVYFSFAGNITYPVKKALVGTKDDLTETVKLVPLEKLFVETDCPFLTPQSRRGERNEPAFVMETAEKIASIKGIETALLEKVTRENAFSVFMI